jgi:hypothetical protein
MLVTLLPFIEMRVNISNSKSTIHRYLLTPYVNIINSTIYEEVSLSCTKDSQCFSDRCFNNECVPNEKINIQGCMSDKCGKLNNDQCSVNDECLSRGCNKKCIDQDFYSDVSPYRAEYILFGILSTLLFLAVICGCICFWTQPNEFPPLINTK